MGTFAERAVFTSPETQPVLDFVGSPERLLVSGPQAGGEFALAEATAPRGHTAPRHRHLRDTESFIVMDGELLIEVGDDRHRAGPGHVAVLPRAVPHTFVVVSATARYLVLHTPAGFDDFIHDVSAAARTGHELNPPALTELAAQHGIEILGPGLDLPDQG
jgi:quercetin dioxygenase-like cupin family protein